MQVHASKIEESDIYDAVPYESYPFKLSHPAHLFTMGTLFDLNPTPIEKARVLELGCSSGGNLIPLAVTYPQSQFVGVDFSKTSIDLGDKHIDALELKNIDLKHMLILDFPKEEGLFDYIICHGVFSWVNKKTREKIFNICEDNLKSNGVAYISYNTLPGWNMVNSIRDLMLWHTQSIDDPKQKVTQARMILKFITDGLEEDTSPYSQFLKYEIKPISKLPDNYILHEHLSLYNEPMYFFEFMEQASKRNLAYLSDAMLSTMYTGNLPKSFAEELNKIHNIIATNQYMDFIRNNRFRSTLLCHSSQEINRKLNFQDVTKWYLQLNAKLNESDFTEEVIHSDKIIKMSFSGITLSANKPNNKAVMYVLYKNRFKLLNYDELKSQVKQYCPVNEAELDHLLLNEVNLMRMVLAGLLDFSCYPSSFTTTINGEPKACPLARYQAGIQSYVSTRHHQVARLDPFAKAMLPNLDGKHTHQQIIKMLNDKTKKGELTVLDHDKNPITNEKNKIEILEQLYFQTLNRFAETGVLID